MRRLGALRQARGRQGEALARSYLRRHGYVLEAANVRYRVGELDVVARDGQTLCFVEVRTVATPRFGPAAGSIDLRKQRRVLAAAQAYLQSRRPRWQGPIRCDAVAIDAAGSSAQSVTLIRNAFDAAAAPSSWW